MMRVLRNPVALQALLLALAASGCDNGLKATATKTVPIPATPMGGIELGSSAACRDEKDFMCSGDRGPHRVALTGFEIEVTEVTRLQYQQCLDQRICDVSPEEPFNDAEKNQPVRIRDPKGAKQYCATVNGRLPTEAEFEYAARLGQDMKPHAYPWGDTPPDCKDVPFGTCPNAVLGPVGTHPVDATALGVLDLAGSVPEWVDGFYNELNSCIDHLGYADACVNSKTPDACAEARCAFDETQMSCVRGCFPGPGENGDAGGRGGFEHIERAIGHHLERQPRHFGTVRQPDRREVEHHVGGPTLDELDHARVSGPAQSVPFPAQSEAAGLAQSHLSHDGPSRAGDEVDPMVRGHNMRLGKVLIHHKS